MKPIAFTLTLLALALFALPGFADTSSQIVVAEAEVVEALTLDWEAISNAEALPLLTQVEAPATVGGLQGTTSQLMCIEGGDLYCETSADWGRGCRCMPNNCCSD